jgi:uncharacterized protein YukE
MTWLDWQPLTTADPVPGDPETVRELASHYGQAAAAAEDVAAELGRLRRAGASVAWDGAAAEACAARVGELPGDLAAVAARFHRVAEALRAFGPALESAQRRARAALTAAHDAQALAGVRPGTPAWPRPLLVTAESPQQRGLGEAIERAQRLLAAAVEERDRAAARCARDLHGAGDDPLRDPHGWHRVLSVVSRVAGDVAGWLGVAAVVLCWVPGLGQALAAVALGAGTIGLLADLALAGYGDKGWRDLGLDALGLVPAGKSVRFAAALPREAVQLRAVARAALHVRPVTEVGQGSRRLAAAAAAGRAAPSGRSMATFLRSEGGLLDEIGRARELRRRGAALVVGGHGVDAAQAGLALPDPPRGRR